jgi:hypothetical protein
MSWNCSPVSLGLTGSELIGLEQTESPQPKRLSCCWVNPKSSGSVLFGSALFGQEQIGWEQIGRAQSDSQQKKSWSCLWMSLRPSGSAPSGLGLKLSTMCCSHRLERSESELRTTALAKCW